jgi:drug/metabolite transporter (DMT)-like permease
MTRKGIVLFVVMGIVWGIPYLLIRIAVRELSPPLLVFCRTAPAGLLLIPLVLRGGGFRPVLAKWRPVLAFTVVEVALPWIFLTRAEQRLASSLSGLVVATVPLIGVVIGRALPGAPRLDPRRLLGLAIGLAGVALVVGVDVTGASLGSVGEVIITSCGYATGPLIVGRYLRDLPAISVIATAMLLTAAAYAPVALHDLPQHLSPSVIASVAILIVVCTALAFTLFFQLIAEVGPQRATVITYVNPVVALVLGVVILHEHFTSAVGFGLPMVLVGSFLATRGAPSATIPRRGDAALPITGDG